MYAPGHATPPPRRPSDGTLIGLRVLFTVLTVLSCGLLGWAAMLRLAVVTRRGRDWTLFALALVASVGVFAYAGTAPTDDKGEITDGASVVVGLWLILLIAVVLAVYLTLEIQHFSRLGAPGHGPAGGGYGYPGPTPAPVHQPPVHQPPVHQPPVQQPVQPVRQTPPEPRQHPAAPPPAHHRIHQVRAELDELSDLLRQDDRRREEEK
ncbi:hypothetical protein C6N75_29215 [Streptomyces solincola]|uniref:Integral membrane protein n=1 Tax=Streptomyces solincola TaxID=2100817 RepID=A0A2S9PN22_9ACTN|nr:hypothetical protein [Streptomyces solincola]PRH75767.1 hypothetical protein C6N75_29215 [Streptomyces solincola]